MVDYFSWKICVSYKKAKDRALSEGVQHNDDMIARCKRGDDQISGHHLLKIKSDGAGSDLASSLHSKSIQLFGT